MSGRLVRDLALAVGHLAPEKAAALAPSLAECTRLQWGATAEALALLGRYAPEAVRGEIARLLAEPPPDQPEAAAWVRSILLGIGLGVGDPTARAEAADAKDDLLPQILGYAALASPEAAVLFIAEAGHGGKPWVIAGAAFQISGTDPQGALTLAHSVTSESGEGRYVAGEVVRRVAEQDPETALRELTRLSQLPGSLDGMPVGAILRVVAEARLAAGGGLVPGAGLDLPLDLSQLPMSTGTRASALAGLAVAMAPRYPEQAKAAMLEALKIAGSAAESPWALAGTIPLLAVVDPEAALSAALEVPAVAPQPGPPPPRLQVLLALARGLAEELGWSEEPIEW